MTDHFADDKNISNRDEFYEQATVEYPPGTATRGVAKLQNVLHGQSKEQLYAEVDQFVEEHGLQSDVDIFRKAALLAQRPNDYMAIAELSKEDKDALQYEGDHKWHYPWKLWFTVITCAIGAATQGWDQTGSNGANLSFPTEFGIATPVGQPGGAADEWKVGFVNSAPYISASLLGVWLSDPLNNWFGRRGEIFITSIILIITPIASGFTHSWEALAAVRLVLGLALGAKAATVPMYAAEMAPAVVRGALVMGWQLWTAFGIFIGFCANAVVKDTGAIAWRLQLGSAFIPAVPLAFLVWFCPESPRWYMKKGRMDKAWNSMKAIRTTELQAARDLYYAYVQFKEEQKTIRGATYVARFTELFTIPRCRRATYAASAVMLAQQMCGINIMAFYSSTIFAEGGYTPQQALYASIGFGAVNFLFAWPAVFTIDTFGRRSLLLLTFPNMCWTLLAGGMMFFIEDLKLRTTLVAFFVYLFTAFYSIGEGPVPNMYSAEVFPIHNREQGMAWAVAVTNFFSSVLALTFPRLLRTFTAPGAFAFYAGLNAVAFVMLYCLLPETKQLTLEELDQVFSIPTGTFCSYQVKTVAPWWFKRYVLFNKNAVCEPLYVEDPDISHRA
ncbi:uncharacterized protein I206_107534 [Kwoniella pini CBS 10737]|uniref:Major facilitator superfamily (MFS) profile domain-containing protein n=1 Tax=Kwoniella pini CBS 10737 TaxID=1296096 RepID=A0A1B9HXK0_9TREE|nr:uncharacterized protein I206_05862 [Kwoniella pini CBS 10737]OCF47996.1 hypothetical protein I206_05862 [Kwoniella pini CBS 10737]